MFKPNYTNTNKITSLIGQIEALHGRLEGMQIPSKLLLNLEKDNLRVNSQKRLLFLQSPLKFGLFL